MANSDAIDDGTIAFYRTEAPVYAASGPDGVSRFLETFLERLPEGARILELGCGGGRDSQEMLARGFDVLPTDGVPEIARQAEARIRRPVRVMTFDEMDFCQEFDAVWANACLLHVPRPALPDVLRRVHQALKLDGLHFANFKAGGVEGRDEHDRYFNYLSHGDMLAAYEASGGWDVIESGDYVGGGYRQFRIPWVKITVRKRG